MKQKVVLITGALTGIGRATALQFAASGADVVISGRSTDAGETLLSQLIQRGANAIFVPADVRDEAEVRELVALTVDRFGRLDVAVNNAGTEGKRSLIYDETVENYQDTFDTNVLGTFLCMKHELVAMLIQRSGCIVNLSSMVGHVGFGGASLYTASKHAIEGLTKSAALEVAPRGLRVNAVAPGPVATDMLERFTGRDMQVKNELLQSIPAKRAAHVDEIVKTIVFLASDDAPFLTGQVITVDGGFTAQ
jgi:NAD(P)-dependent dehydrogenase (short-subunit alcohol dehydrogenase family)